MEATKSAAPIQLPVGKHVHTCKEAFIERMPEGTSKRCQLNCPGDGDFKSLATARSFRQSGNLCRQEPSTRPLPNMRPFRAYQCRSAHILRYGLLSIFVCLLITPATAALINFQNCLSQVYQNNNPPALQFVPLFMDASFNTTDPSHRLVVTVWGNVTEVYTKVQLPPSTDPDWTNPNFTNGKIENLPAPGTKWTTLSKKVNVLTYEPWKQSDKFCDVLVNGTCPLGPSFTANA